MARLEKGFGEHCNDDVIRDILRENARREKPIGERKIINHMQEKTWKGVS